MNEWNGRKLDAIEFNSTWTWPTQLDCLLDTMRSMLYTIIYTIGWHKKDVKAGFIKKEQINYDQGGYYHVYSATNPDEIANGMQRLLNDWYAKMGQLIREFEEKYAENANTQSGPESGPGSDPKKGSNSGSDPNTETEVTAER